ncbi:phosphate acetyltransferase [Alpinimonas psychrophila]|uniref:Phosphate acetyltransferase n=1 Tax=Alpinimonas psychrophila TaxID=748908 RepID=A0A7W3JUY7_9MICO|nr:phosphate acetyltransferase [Alpinimonas psychrophila]MBA8829738.1 phosphate acetyltransferase [Alpinimonas psychrophila]
MARSVYLASVEGHTGKSTIALGVLDVLRQSYDRVGVFRAVARTASTPDYVLELLLAHTDGRLNYNECVGVTYDDVHANPEAALARIVDRYKALEAQCDAVVIVGSDYTDVGSPTELSYNARVATNVGAPLVLVLNGRESYDTDEHLGQAPPRSAEDLKRISELALVELVHEHSTLAGVMVNRADGADTAAITVAVTATLPAGVPVWVVTDDPSLAAPRMTDVTTAVNGTLVFGSEDRLQTEALEVVVAAMSMVNVLLRLLPGAVVVVPSDRTEVLLALVMADAAETFPNLAGIVLNGGFEIPEPVARLLHGLNSTLPVVATTGGSFDTTVSVIRTRGRLEVGDAEKVAKARAVFAAHVNGADLMARIEASQTSVVTPLLFEYALAAKARAAQRHVVLPEGGDDRILSAAAEILAKKIARITILGDPATVASRAAALGLDLGGASVISVHDPELSELFATEYARLRSHKGVTLERAREVMKGDAYFATMMVQLGLADGMVSGAVNTTANTIRPAFEIVKTQPDVSIVSSVFFMALADRVLVYGDCAVVPDPTAEQLADIAISSAETARSFGIEPRIAMLSYSTGTSGSGSDVEKVRIATALVRERRPDLVIEGPIQYDAAVDVAIAAAKLPESRGAGNATVFIFPDLNTGNNTYKAVQRTAGAVAIGPILQGLRKPINDLSRGARVSDIVNTIAITAIQAATLDSAVPSSTPNETQR